MYSSLIATFGIFVLSASVCSTSTLTEEAVTELRGNETITDSDLTGIGETVFSTQLVQSMTDIGTTETAGSKTIDDLEEETTRLNTIAGNFTTKLSSRVEEMTIIASTASNEIPSSQDIAITLVKNDQATAEIETNDNVLTTYSFETEVETTATTKKTIDILEAAVTTPKKSIDNLEAEVTTPKKSIDNLEVQVTTVEETIKETIDNFELETTTLKKTIDNFTPEMTIEITSPQSDSFKATGQNDDTATILEPYYVLTTNSIDFELSNNEMKSSTMREEMFPPDTTSSTDCTDNTGITVTVNDDKDDYTSTRVSFENKENNYSSCVFEIDDLTSLNSTIMYEHTMRNQFETWQDLKANNETNQVNTIIFTKSIEVIEWFVIYDKMFREGFSELLTERWKQLIKVEEKFANCAPFLPDDIIYVAPSPLKLRQSTVIGFMVCNPIGEFCLELEKLFDMEISRLENKLNLTILGILNGHILMDYHSDRFDCQHELSIILSAIILTGTSALIGFIIGICIALCCRRKSGSFNTRVVSYMSNRSLQNLSAFGRNLATDQQCQMEELGDTLPSFNNQHRSPCSSSHEIRRSIRREDDQPANIDGEKEPQNNKDLEAQL